MAKKTSRLAGLLFLLFLVSGSFHFARARYRASDLSAVQPADESMNGTALRLGPSEWTVNPRDDKDTLEAANHRSWWYVKLEGVAVDTVTLVNIRGDGWNGVRFAPPVYSYDRKTWIPFNYSDLTRRLTKKYRKYQVSLLLFFSSDKICKYYVLGLLSQEKVPRAEEKQKNAPDFPFLLPFEMLLHSCCAFSLCCGQGLPTRTLP